MLPTLALVGAALVAAWFVWPTSLGGCTTLTIVSGHSMEPTYYTGDLVVARCGDPVVGDVIVYQPTEVGGARVIHRIIGGDAATGWRMQGDNNGFVDPWTPAGDEVLGVGGLHLAGVGRLALLLVSPVLWVSLVVLAAGLLVWPGADPDSPDDGRESDGDGSDGDDDGDADAGDDAGDDDRPEGREGRRRGAAKRLRLLPLGLLLAVPLALQVGFPVAHAASLPLNPGSLYAFTQAGCAGLGTAQVSVEIFKGKGDDYWALGRGFPAALRGKAFSVTALGQSGALATATGTVGSDGTFSAQFNDKANGASRTLLLIIEGCAVPATWT